MAKERLGGDRKLLLSSQMIEMLTSMPSTLPLYDRKSFSIHEPVEVSPVGDSEQGKACWTTRTIDPLTLKKKQIRSLLLKADEVKPLKQKRLFEEGMGRVFLVSTNHLLATSFRSNIVFALSVYRTVVGRYFSR